MVQVLRISILLLIGSLFFLRVRPQSPLTQVEAPSHVIPKPSQYSLPWQRLLLLLSSTHYAVAREMDVDLDSSLLLTSRLLGLSRLPVVGEGWEDSAWLNSNAWFDKRDPGEARRLLPGLQGTGHLRLLVLLGAYYAFQPDAYQRFKDSVLFYLSAARQESTRLREGKWDRRALCLLGKVFAEGNDLRQSGFYFDECVKECQEANDSAGEARAWMYRGLYTPYSAPTTGDRIAYLLKARDKYRILRMPGGEINSLMDEGYLWVTEVQVGKAKECFLEALDLEDSIRFPFTHYMTDNLSMVTNFQGKYGEPLKFALQSVKTAEATGDSVEWGVFYNRLGVLYSLREDKRKESLYWEKKSLDYYLQMGGDAGLYMALYLFADTNGNAAETLVRTMQIAKRYPPRSSLDLFMYHWILDICYLDLRQYDLAEKNVQEMAEIEKEKALARGTISGALVDLQFGYVYFTEGRFALAKDFLRRCVSDPYSVMMSPENYLNAYRMLYTIDSANGDYPSAFNYLKQYTLVLDSTLNIQLQRQAEELGVQYETEKKEGEIQVRDQRILMLQQADMLRLASLRHAEFLRNVTIAGIIVLMVIGGLLYRQYRQKQKISEVIADNNDMITSKNEMLERLLAEKDWLLKEVHHRVKNNLHTVISLLESQARHLQHDALDAIESSQHRIYAMSLVHQKVYQSEELREIDMGNYLPEFIGYLRDSFGNPPNIFFLHDIEPLKLGVTLAIPVALIVNEAVTNSIKYAFPDNRTGQIIVRFRREGVFIKLSVSDNGIGMDPKVVNTELSSVGIELMKGLSREIGAKIFFETDGGTTVLIIFATDIVIN
jgi:two-component sensor histidine kinase